MKTPFKVRLGEAVGLDARVIALWWDARRVAEWDAGSLNPALKDVPAASGVYAVTGHHDAHHAEGLLYFGKAKNLSERVPDSIRDCLSEKHASGQELLFSDIWDLTIRWARLEVTLLADVEELEIMSHSPLFNSQGVRRKTAQATQLDLIIMNAGRKGPLLPILAGAYQAPGWDNNGRTITT